jgi:hypothetical protein
MSSEFVFVDTLDGLARARERRLAFIGTDNPLFAHDPRAGAGLNDLSLHLEQAEAARLGRAANDILLALDDLIGREGIGARYGGQPGRLNVTMSLRALFSTLIHRGLMLQRALAAFGTGKLVFVVPDQPRWLASQPWNMPRFACPHRALAEEGFFDNRPIEWVPVPFEAPKDFNDTATEDLWLRVLLVPAAVAMFELAKRCRLTKASGSQSIVFGKRSETLDETLPWLALRGFSLRRLELPSYAGLKAPPFGTPVHVDPWLREAVEPVLFRGLAALGVFQDHSARSIARVVLQHLWAGLSGLEASVKATGAALDQAFEGVEKPWVLATSGVYGPAGTQLLALCRDKGITFVDFEHGATTGIAQTSERRLAVCEATTCDVLMASSTRAARSFARANGQSPSVQVIGLADQTRSIRHRPLQRWRARQMLSLKPRERAVIHVSTLLYGGNMRPGDDTPVEQYVYGTESTLLTQVYPNVDKTVLYKPYPTLRFPHHASYADLFDLAPNVRLIDRADFRYVRAAADIIVTQANSSTLGWCVGADVPLIHLGSRDVHALVDDDLRSEFAASFVTVNMDRDDWPQALQALLNRDIDDLKDEWNQKAPARRRLITDGIVGPPGSVGRRAARILADLYAH